MRRGRALRERTWHDVLDALHKDVPDMSEVVEEPKHGKLTY